MVIESAILSELFGEFSVPAQLRLIDWRLHFHQAGHEVFLNKLKNTYSRSGRTNFP